MFGLAVIVPVQSAEQTYWNWLSGAPGDPIIGPTYTTQDLLDTQALRGARERALASIADTTLARTVNRQLQSAPAATGGQQTVASSQQPVTAAVTAIPWTPLLIALAAFVLLLKR